MIHRDLKPANIKVRADGTVKVLDFGLAKALDLSPSADLDQSPTLTAAATQMGVIMGTAAYMSQEQAKGLPVDKRADIWAFGAVLYEMLTGRRPFEAGDVSEMLASVLLKDPDISGIDVRIPEHIRGLLRRCLAKDTKERLRDIGDVKLVISGAFAAGPPTPFVASEPESYIRSSRMLGVAAVGLVAATSLVTWLIATPTDDTGLERTTRFVASAPPSAPVSFSNQSPDVGVSPDGSLVVYRTIVGPSGDSFLYLRRTDQLEGFTMEGSRGFSSPFFSPDGAWLGYAGGAIGSPIALKRVSLADRVESTITQLPLDVRGASWGTDGWIVFALSDGELYRVREAGGETERLTAPNTSDAGGIYHWPHVLPGAAAALVQFAPVAGGSEAQIALFDLATREHTTIVARGLFPRYVATGHVLYALDGAVWAVPFDLDTKAVTGPPVPVFQDVSQKNNGATNFAVANDGTLVHTTGGGTTGVGRSLLWAGGGGAEEALDLPPRPYDLPRLSPDGRLVAYDVEAPDNMDVYVFDLDRGISTRLTSDPARDGAPLWTSDGREIVFGSSRDGGGIFVTNADGSGESRRWAPARLGGGTDLMPHAWSADGQTLVYYRSGGPTTGDIYALTAGAEAPEPLFTDELVFEGHPSIAPNGRWLAFTSNESGQNEVYVVPFPDVGGRRVKVTEGGAREPLWSRDGQRLYYRLQLQSQGGATIAGVSIDQDADAISPGGEVVYSDGDFDSPQAGRHYDVSAEGRLLRLRLLPQTAGADAEPRVVVVTNWFQELRERVPAP